MYNVVQKKIYDFFPQDREINEPMKRYYIHVCDFLFGKYFFFWMFIIKEKSYQCVKPVYNRIWRKAMSLKYTLL